MVGSLLPVAVDGNLLEGVGVQQGSDLRPGGHLLDQVVEFWEVIQGLGAQNQVVQQQVKQVVVRERHLEARHRGRQSMEAGIEGGLLF